MRLIKSKDTVEFLSKAAPRPWVCRMLCWMVIDGQIDAYFDKAHIQGSGSAFQYFIPHREEAGEESGPKMDEIIRREYGREMADKLAGKNAHDKILDDPIEWEAEDGPQALDAGYILYASEIDWDAGIVNCDWLPDDREIKDMWFPSSEFLYSEFEHAEYTAKLEGMAFELNRIEMLLPTSELRNSSGDTKQAGIIQSHIGRPRKWDWEGALAHIVAEAQTPDGLPTGHGAQAKVEAMIANWFEAQSGNSPAVSQIRQRASKVMALIGNADKD